MTGVNTSGATMPVTWGDVIWASVSVGKLSLSDIFRHGPFSTSEIRFKTHLLYANLMQKTSGEFGRSPLYDSLDSTEKGAVSYFLGMAMAKLFVSRLFGVHWLVHLEKLRRYRAIRLVGKSRPDLIGATSAGQWVVVEAKGRTNLFSQAAIDKAKDQTRMVRTISGSPPSLKIATESYFSRNLQIRLVDPNEYEPNAVSVEIEGSDFVRTYYEPFVTLLDGSEWRNVSVDQRTFLCTSDADSGVSIGLSTEVFKALKDRQLSFGAIADVVGRVGDPTTVDRTIYQVYPDGLAIGVDHRWADATMAHTPERRG